MLRGARVRLLAVFSAWQLLLHLLQCIESRDPRLWMPHAVAYLQDVSLLVGWFVALAAIGRLLRDRTRIAWGYFTAVGLFGIGIGLASYPRFLHEYLAFPVNIFAADGGSAWVLLKEYLGLGSLWPVGVAAGLGAAALAVRIRLPLPSRVHVATYIVIVGVVVATLACPSPQPFVYSMQQQLKLSLTHDRRVVPTLRRPPAGSEGDRALSLPQIHATDLRADHVLLIVLEGVTSDTFEREFLARGDGFYSRVQEHAAYFNQYYATNLDSYTSLIAMLTSVQVPYRAYADEKLYRAVNQVNSLPRSLRKLGFRTLYICTCAHQPFVPTRNEWDRVMHRGNLPSLEGWVSLGSSRMEAATEDRAGLSTIEEFVAQSSQSFVLDELVFGHSPEWRARTGQTQLGYYDAYLNDLLDRLQARDLASRSLLVIVSDHGDRAKASDAANYRVPLLIVGEGVRSCLDESFRSHLDLQPIVISYLSGEAMPPPRSQIFVVGSTERWVYGAVSESGGCLFIDDATGRILSHSGTLDPLEVHEGFQSALDEFGLRFGR
jgi:hypothetical protein